jgi:hypothetical protein
MSDAAYFTAINNTEPRGTNRILWDAQIYLCKCNDIPFPQHLRDAVRILEACRVLVALTETWYITEEQIL